MGFSRRRFLDVVPNPVEDLSGSISEALTTLSSCFSDLAQVCWLLIQEIQSGTRVVARGGNRLADFVRQRGGQFSHHAHAVHVSEIRLHLLQHAPTLVCDPRLSVARTYQRDEAPGGVGWDVTSCSNHRYSPSERRRRSFVNRRGCPRLVILKSLKKYGVGLRDAPYHCSPVRQPFQRSAEILDALAIDGFDFTVRS